MKSSNIIKLFLIVGFLPWDNFLKSGLFCYYGLFIESGEVLETL